METVEEKKCKLCGKERPSRRYVYCSVTCQKKGQLARAKVNAQRRYQLYRDDPDFREYSKNRAAKWYQAHKEKHNEETLKYYHNNKNIWNTRVRISNNKKLIQPFLSSQCSVCGKEDAKMFYYKKGFEKATPKRIRPKNKEEEKKLKEFTIKYIKPACSLRCIGKMRRR